MSTFFNKKEDVIQIELTQYGKYLLSKGRFKPALYSFFDDEILYDISYGGLSEEQNDTVTRIKDSVFMKTIYDFSSSLEYPTPYSASSLGVIDTNHALSKPIGTMDPAKIYRPSWNVSVATPESVEMSSSVVYVETYNRGQAVPQLFFTGTYTYNTVPVVDLETEESIVLDISEVNTLFKTKGNFSVEVFEVTSGSGEIVKQLSFIPDAEARSENDFIRASEAELNDRYPDINNTFTEFYLDIRLDREIDDIGRVQIIDSNLYNTLSEDDDGEVC
jgi:hypothetical protein